MDDELNKSNAKTGCPEFERQILLYAVDELEGAERDAFEDHLDHCARCFAALESERHLLDILSPHGGQEPTPALLASCRGRLEDALDRQDHRSLFARWAESIFPAHWLALHPAASAATLILLGFSVGSFVAWHVPKPVSPYPAAPVASRGLNEQELRSADVSGINWMPTNNNQPPHVEVQMTTEKPIVVRGTVNDQEVKQVLLYVLSNNRRFGPDIRISAAELLRGQAGNPDVQQALCHAVRNDRNPAVRLKALDALADAPPNAAIVQTMLDALTNDANPGVRIEAINSLRALSGRGAFHADPRAVNVLKRCMKNDPNKYIRLESAAAIQQYAAGPQE